jgi:hypothetical protein
MDFGGSGCLRLFGLGLVALVAIAVLLIAA